MSISIMGENGLNIVPTCMGGGANKEILNRISHIESEIESIKHTYATTENYGVSKITDAEDVTETQSGLVLSAIHNNPNVENSLRSRIESLTKIETVDVSWDESAFPGTTISKFSQKIGNTVYINYTKYNGPSSIQTGKTFIAGKINNYIPTYLTKPMPVGTQNTDGSTRKIIGCAQVDPAGSILVQLQEQSDWIMFLVVEYVYQ